MMKRMRIGSHLSKTAQERYCHHSTRGWFFAGQRRWRCEWNNTTNLVARLPLFSRSIQKLKRSTIQDRHHILNMHWRDANNAVLVGWSLLTLGRWLLLVWSWNLLSYARWLRAWEA